MSKSNRDGRGELHEASSRWSRFRCTRQTMMTKPAPVEERAWRALDLAPRMARCSRPPTDAHKAAPPPQASHRFLCPLYAALPGVRVVDHYGQSETGPLTILKPWETETHKGTIGRAATGVDIRLVDEEGNPVPPGTIGELTSRGPFLMEGYFVLH